MRAEQRTIRTCADVSTDWLTTALGEAVCGFQIERIGTTVGGRRGAGWIEWNRPQ